MVILNRSLIDVHADFISISSVSLREDKLEISEWKDGWQLWDLVAHLTKIRAVSSNNLFRGQTDADWALLPGLYRRDVHIFNDAKSKEELYLIAEQRMIEAFFDRAAMLLPNFPRSPLMDRIIAQHYGVPTQLLDWTIDPFIALYFAVHGGNPDKDCALFYLNPLTGLNKGMRHINLPWRQKITLVPPPIIDERIRSQKSAFTIQNFGEKEFFTPLDERKLKFSGCEHSTHADDEVMTIGKIIIPSERRQQILFQLIELGVDSSLVYPGLQGIGQRIADIANIQKYGGGQGY
ncbi:FRG domain-containing protein [Asticcacaulis sp. ZE23SCel15]|uniref:FRG domain-containing protein n=1 Tax=Asticcacaulis sp. ZE23SCel15 TaxID=3059027 RepID=UPI00265DCB3E|nr:FRG domain-containing protein [Asticcacaulis sp. ZE23SCel15]WKL58706.1 FRG domain-containing protein [Asticcacaulis sp. ZE23SCel15]